MKQPRLLLSLSLSLVACISTKDLGVESDTTSNVDDTATSTGSSSGDSQTSQAQTTQNESESASESDSESGVAETDTFGSTSGESFGESGIVETTGDTEGTTGGFGDEQDLCEATGGIWDPGACGHYICGFQQDCGALIPGCDCGIYDVFQPKVGCVPSPECEPSEFACGDAGTCLAGAEYCDVTLPGPKGPTIYDCANVPKACADDYTCGCLDAAGLVEPGECVQGADLGITVTIAKP